MTLPPTKALKGYLEKKDPVSAERQAHTIKGASDNLEDEFRELKIEIESWHNRIEKEKNVSN